MPRFGDFSHVVSSDGRASIDSTRLASHVEMAGLSIDPDALPPPAQRKVTREPSILAAANFGCFVMLNSSRKLSVTYRMFIKDVNEWRFCMLKKVRSTNKAVRRVRRSQPDRFCPHRILALSKYFPRFALN